MYTRVFRRNFFLIFQLADFDNFETRIGLQVNCGFYRTLNAGEIVMKPEKFAVTIETNRQVIVSY
jgi:hypothetical protein